MKLNRSKKRSFFVDKKKLMKESSNKSGAGTYQGSCAVHIPERESVNLLWFAYLTVCLNRLMKPFFVTQKLSLKCAVLLEVIRFSQLSTYFPPLCGEVQASADWVGFCYIIKLIRISIAFSSLSAVATVYLLIHKITCLTSCVAPDQRNQAPSLAHRISTALEMLKQV